MYSDASNFHIRVELFEHTPRSDRTATLWTTLTRKYGRFTTYSSRIPEYDYAPDIPLLDGIEVLIAEWDTKQEFDLGKDPPCWPGLILVPKEGEASTYERIGVWLPYGATECRLQLRNHSDSSRASADFEKQVFGFLWRFKPNKAARKA